MKILVTGGMGFIGSHVSQALLAKGHLVSIADTFTNFGDRDFNENLDYRKRITKGASLLRKTASHPDVWREPYDVVIHLAGIPIINPKTGDFYKVNIHETDKVLSLAKKKGTRRFIFMSSLYAYGMYRGTPYLEDSPLHPVDGYGISKAVGEYLTRFYFNDREWMIVRTAGVFGFGDHNPRISRLIVELSEEFPHLTITKGVERTFIYINDLVQGIVSIVDTPVTNQAFNLITETMTIEKFAKIVNKYIPSLHWELRECPAGELIIGPADISKARKLLDFFPGYTVESGIKEYLMLLKKYKY